MDYGLQAIKLVIGILTLTLTFRLLGKKNLAQLSPFDLVHVIVFGGILDSIFYDDEIGILPFIFTAMVWTLSIYIMDLLAKKYNLFRTVFRGTPDHIIENGKLNMRLFDRANIEMEELRSVLRQKDIFSLREVKDLFLEPDGRFSVIRYAKYRNVEDSSKEDYYNFLLIDEGEVQREVLKYIGKEEVWLKGEMKTFGVEDLTKVVYCEWSKEEGFYYKMIDDCINEVREGYIN
ncbi:YetF domain-containing protein [Proteiniclasticum sp.]|uniref:DUF421 domain-containing protein n=1 Tax=Proteiniclasticum sp. TaxID=2053595 RepID=UPI002897A186|nr:YetF domain-containing protein [Proteiniclasticum sp.]